MDDLEQTILQEKKQNIIPYAQLTWMTTKEAAFYIRRSVNALRILLCRRYLRARKVRRRLYFKKSDLDRLIERGEISGAK